MYSPKYLISNRILKNIGATEAAKEIIENAPLVPTFEKQFQSDAMVRTVYHGTHIEGNDLTLIQTKKVLEGLTVYGRPRESQGGSNTNKALGPVNSFFVQKGPKTIVCGEDKCVEVTNGNAGLTKGGTGDILAGLTVALYAKNEAFLAASSASYITKTTAN